MFHGAQFLATIGNCVIERSIKQGCPTRGLLAACNTNEINLQSVGSCWGATPLAGPAVAASWVPGLPLLPLASISCTCPWECGGVADMAHGTWGPCVSGALGPCIVQGAPMQHTTSGCSKVGQPSSKKDPQEHLLWPFSNTTATNTL